MADETVVQAFSDLSDSDEDSPSSSKHRRASAAEGKSSVRDEGKQAELPNDDKVVVTYDVDYESDESDADFPSGVKDPVDGLYDTGPRSGSAAGEGKLDGDHRPVHRPVEVSVATEEGAGFDASHRGAESSRHRDFEPEGPASTQPDFDSPRDSREFAHDTGRAQPAYFAMADSGGAVPSPAAGPGGHASPKRSPVSATAFDPCSENLLRFPDGVVHCLITRNRKGVNRLYPQYTLYLQAADGSTVPLLLAQKQKSNRTSNYHIFDMTMGVAGGALSKKHNNFIGKLRTSFRKYECVMYGRGDSHKHLSMDRLDDDAVNRALRPELGAVFFRKTSLVSQITDGAVPRKMEVLLPLMDEAAGQVREYKPRSEEESLLNRHEKDDVDDCLVLEAKEPTYSSGTYRLNFYGRVTEASVKNFQLVFRREQGARASGQIRKLLTDYADLKAAVDDERASTARKGIARSDCIALQFGKVGEERFHLDFRAPFTAFHAFAVVLCQFNL